MWQTGQNEWLVDYSRWGINIVFVLCLPAANVMKWRKQNKTRDSDISLCTHSCYIPLGCGIVYHAAESWLDSGDDAPAPHRAHSQWETLLYSTIFSLLSIYSFKDFFKLDFTRNYITTGIFIITKVGPFSEAKHHQSPSSIETAPHHHQ